MDRRKALKMAAGAFAAGGAGVFALTNAFKPANAQAENPKLVKPLNAESDWKYAFLDDGETAELAYQNYNVGSCMYGAFSSIIEQLSAKIGAPYNTFPTHMMKYGHGGIGGAGTVCGTLNGASAALGLLIPDKKIRDILIEDLFNWYARTALPNYTPVESDIDYNPPKSVSNSTLCHVSNTLWCKTSGQKIKSKERKERCKRLTADVAAQTVKMLNAYFSEGYTTVHQQNVENNCMLCHSSAGKVSNVATKMDCNSCHEKSVGHQLFGDIHYKLMDD